MIRCLICNQSYSRRDALQRHERNVHNKVYLYASTDNVGPFEIGTRIMEKLVLVPYEKYQRLLDGKAMEKKMQNPPKRRVKDRAEKKGPPGERDKPSAATRYTIKDWISF